MTEQRFDASLKGFDFTSTKRTNKQSEVSDVKFDDVLKKVGHDANQFDADREEILEVLEQVNDAFTTFEGRAKARAKEASEAEIQRQILEQNHTENGFRKVNQSGHQG